MSRVHIYCRVSSAGQEENTSFETQEQTCRAWADERGFRGAVAHEVFSSGELHRPKLDAMIGSLEAGDVLLSYSPDRLSRHQKHPHILEWMIEEKGARLAYALRESPKPRKTCSRQRHELHERRGTRRDPSPDAEWSPRSCGKRPADPRLQAALWSGVGRSRQEDPTRARSRDGRDCPPHL